MLSKQEVQHIAKLARLGLSDEELEKYRRDLSSILDYAVKLQEVNVDGVEPTSHSISMKNVMRNDEEQKEDADRVNKMMDQVPQKEKGFVKVRAVL